MSGPDSPIPAPCFYWVMGGRVHALRASPGADTHWGRHGAMARDGFESDFSGNWYMGHQLQYGTTAVDQWE